MNTMESSYDTKYRCELFGLGDTLIIYKDKRPNWFWRMMQYLCLENNWKVNKV